MRNGSNARRSRGRPNNTGRRNNGRPNNNVFDSNGPEGRIRGTAQQVYDKYMAQAADAIAADDTVLSESLHQHAEHYLRVLLNDTDIDIETYRQQQMNKGQELPRENDSNDDNAVASSKKDKANARQPNHKEQAAPSKRPNNNPNANKGSGKSSGNDGDRMTDVPSFLASAPDKTADKQKQKELESEPA